MYRHIKHILVVLTIVLAAYASHSYASDEGTNSETYTLYSAPGGEVTLVVGHPESTYRSDRPVLTFNDEKGLPVSVFSQHSVTLAEAQAYLVKCRAAGARANAIRQRLAKKEGD